jgi:hypothetical protein
VEAGDHWRVLDGELLVDGAGPGLRTAVEYGDFEMLAQWKIEAGGAATIYLKGIPAILIRDPAAAPEGSIVLIGRPNPPADVLAEKDKAASEDRPGKDKVVVEDQAGKNKAVAGAQGATDKASVSPAGIADLPAGEWNTLFVKMAGDKLTVHLNGTLLVENVALENVPASGPVGFASPGKPLALKNIRIK